MCLWLITACLGLLPPNPNPTIVIVQGVPTPILPPTTAPTTTTAAPTTAPPPPTAAPTMAPPPTTAPTMAPPPTTAPTTSPPPTSAPTTAPPPTTAPTTAPPPPPTTVPTTAPPPTTAPTPTTTTTTTTTARPTTGNSITSPAPIVTNIVPSQMTIVIDSREELLPVLCNNPDVLCISNPDDNASGALQIDPRLGTTPAASAALQQPPISGYSAQIPSYDTSVRFPRDKRSILRRRKNKKITLQNVMKGVQTITDDNHEIEKRQSCTCVPAGTCVRSNTNSGAGMIDVRIVTPGSPCPSGQEYCCGTSVISCGTLQSVPATAVAPAAGQANFGEYPWQALILTKQNDYLAGGVLIDQLNVLTVTHRLTSYIVSGTAPNVKVRLGEWDAAGTYEPVPYQEYTVQKVFSHPSYVANTLQYDITVLRLSTSVPISPMNGAAATINRVCLPPSSTSMYTGQRCWVAGWGKDMFGLQGQYQQILKEVDVPIVAPATCQTQMQAARLGSNFVLDTTSFVCAGGEANKDSCTGDGGSGLVCQVNGQWVLVGLVAWGLGCANANVPAAYVNVAALLPWIQQQVAAA